MKTGNIFDPIQSQLDQRVYNGITPRHTIVEFIERKFYETMEDLLVDDPQQYFDLALTGSLTTYQYSDTSDCDISVFVHYNDLGSTLGYQRAGDIRRDLVHIVTTELDGTMLPGSSHPLQFFVVPPDRKIKDYFQPGIRSGWSFNEQGWIVPPEKKRTHNVADEMPAIYSRCEDIAEKMRELLDSGDDEGARAMYAQIHKKRNMDELSGLGDFSEGNLVYKYLLHEGLFDRLRQEAGVHIASVELFEKVADVVEGDTPISYNFERDKIVFGRSEDRGTIIVGTYDGHNVHLRDVSKQWVNANYFKRLWLHSFPEKPIHDIFMDGKKVMTRPADQMTYTQRVPSIVTGGRHDFEWVSRPELWQLENDPIKGPQRTPPTFQMPESVMQGFLGRMECPQCNDGQSLKQENGKIWCPYCGWTPPVRTSKSGWKKGTEWKSYIKNKNIIVDFQFGDAKDDPVEGRVVEINEDSIRIEVAPGDTKKLDEDMLKQIKFRVRDEKHSLSHKVADYIQGKPNCEECGDSDDVHIEHDGLSGKPKWFCTYCDRDLSPEETEGFELDPDKNYYEAKPPRYDRAFVFLGAPYNRLLIGGSEHGDLISDFIRSEFEDVSSNYEEYEKKMNQLMEVPMAAGHIGIVPDPQTNRWDQPIYAFYSDFFSGQEADFLQLTQEALAKIKEIYPTIRPATDAENNFQWAGGGTYYSKKLSKVASLGDCPFPDCDYEFTSQDHKMQDLGHGWFTCPDCQRTYNLRNKLDPKTSWWTVPGNEPYQTNNGEESHEWASRWGYNTVTGEFRISDQHYYHDTHPEMFWNMQQSDEAHEDDRPGENFAFGYAYDDGQGNLHIIGYSIDYEGSEVPSNVVDELKEHYDDIGRPVNDVTISYQAI